MPRCAEFPYATTTILSGRLRASSKRVSADFIAGTNANKALALAQPPWSQQQQPALGHPGKSQLATAVNSATQHSNSRPASTQTPPPPSSPAPARTPHPKPRPLEPPFQPSDPHLLKLSSPAYQGALSHQGRSGSGMVIQPSPVYGHNPSPGQTQVQDLLAPDGPPRGYFDDTQDLAPLDDTPMNQATDERSRDAGRREGPAAKRASAPPDAKAKRRQR